jgi:predicted regulator of Ras-like GTPase activity (Roadblock/LC7/MglB family)
MFEFLKNMFQGKPVQEPTGGGGAPAVETPEPPPPAARPPAPVVPRPPVNPNGNSVDILLQSVLSGFPLELKGRIRQSDVGEATVSIPMEKVLSQLSSGAVKITFGELRRAAPQLFSPGSDCDQAQVALPLNEILAQVNPALFDRRQNQKRIEVPEEIRSPFGDRGNGLIFSVGPDKSQTPIPARVVTPAAAPRAVTPLPPARASAPPVPPRAVTPAPAPRAITPAPAPRAITPAAPMPPPPAAPPTAPLKPAPPIPMPPARPAVPAPVPAPPAPPAPLKSPIASKPAPPPPTARPIGPPPATPAPPVFRGAGAAPAPQREAAPFRPPAAPQEPALPDPARPAAEVRTLSVPLMSLAEGWPEELRQEIAQWKLTEAKVALPAETVEQALKRGKVAFPWKVLRSWIRSAPQPAISTHDSLALELPLKVIAPLFLQRQKDEAKTHQKVAIDENIPNLFFGFPQPAGSAAGEPATASHAVTKPVDTNYYVWDDTSESVQVEDIESKRGSQPSPGTTFVTRCATPNEVVSRAAALDGVTGALIALPDGLMVASRLAPDLNGDTLAAFLPQIFGKVSQCTKELRMGELNNLNFTVGNVPWKIFRVNAIYFAAFGRPGQPLPTGQLAALAAELDRKKQ